jgi:hypothetical protein
MVPTAVAAETVVPALPVAVMENVGVAYAYVRVKSPASVPAEFDICAPVGQLLDLRRT